MAILQHLNPGPSRHGGHFATSLDRVIHSSFLPDGNITRAVRVICSMSHCPLTVYVSRLQSENDLLGSSYANALVDLASDKNNLEEVHADMDALASILKVRHAMRSMYGSLTDARWTDCWVRRPSVRCQLEA